LSRSDFIFENNILKVMPLDIEGKYTYGNWTKKNSKTENWIELNFRGIELENCIGYGANGIVFEGIDNTTARKCAIKIWLPNRSSKHYNVYLEKYLEEVQKLAALNSKEIVVVYTADKTENGYYYSVMEWVPGITLNSFIEQNTGLKSSIRYSLSKSILATIIGCHKENIFHGDLHSKNILVVQDEGYNNFSIKILDFGTSLLNRHTKPEFSKQRESALILKTILELINGDRLNLLNFKFRGAKFNSNLQSDDVRNFAPLFVSTTLLKLVEIYEILDHNPVTYSVFEDVIIKGLEAPGINIVTLLNYLSENLIEENTSDVNKKVLSQILVEKCEDFLYIDESVGLNTEIIEYRMIPCYFEYIKRKQFKINLNNNLDEILSLNDLEELYNWLNMKKIELDYTEFKFYCIDVSRELNILSGDLIYEDYVIEFIKLREILNKLKFDNCLYDSILELFNKKY